MQIRDIMTPKPQTVTPEDTLIHARDVMVWGDFRHLLVIDKMGALRGVITERDIAMHQSRTGESIFSNPRDPVSMAMSTEAKTANPDDDVIDIANWMASTKVGCLPVTVQGVAVGIVTTTDVLAASAMRDMPRSGNHAPTVSSAMTTNPHTIHPGDKLLDAAGIMKTYQIRHLPVVNGENKIVGMISDRDVRSAFGHPINILDDDKPHSRLESYLVGDHMSLPPITVSPSQNCLEVARFLVSGSPSAVLVADENETLVGILSYVDVLRALADIIDNRV